MEKKSNKKYILIGCGALALIAIIGFIILMAISLLFFVGSDSEEVKTIEEEQKEVINEPEEKEEIEIVEEEPKKIQIDETIELNNATIELQSLRIDDDEAQLYAYWHHFSSYDKAHLDLLITTSITQNGEPVEITKGDDKFLRQIKKGADGGLDMKLKLTDNSPIEFKFTENIDDGETETVVVELE